MFNLIIKSDGFMICSAAVADSLLDSSLGLMFKHHMPKDQGLLIKTGIPNAEVHGIFMRFPLDLVFLDSKNSIVDIGVLPPYRTYKTHRRCCYILELNSGSVDNKDLRVGDVFEFKRCS